MGRALDNAMLNIGAKTTAKGKNRPIHALHVLCILV